MFITIKRRMSKEIKNKFGVLFASVCFVSKMKLALNRYRKRKTLVRQWIDLEKNNLSSINLIKEKTKELQFNNSHTNIILQGVHPIYEHSCAIIQKLNHILQSKAIVFGKKIVQICKSFDVADQYLKRYVQRLMIIKQIGDEVYNKKFGQYQPSRLILQENAQKIIYRTYQISILIAKYIQYLSKTSKDMDQFLLAQQIVTNLNKRYDRLIGEEQKSKQVQRLQRIMGQKINTPFIYTQKCYWHLGQIKVHIFETMVLIEQDKNLTSLNLDKYCSIFIKFYQNLRIVCLVTKTNTVHFLFNFSKQMTKFVKIVQGCIRDSQNMFLFASKIPSLFDPFLSAKIVDFRLSKDKKEEFMIVFSSICQNTTGQDKIFQRSGVKQSNLNWTETGCYNQQRQQLNQRVALSISGLLKIKKTCQSEYSLKVELPKMLNFQNKISQNHLLILRWQAYLNIILRSKMIINNPILILKQLQVSDIFLQASLSKQNLSILENKRQHCKLCQRIVITSLSRYLSQRLHFISVKYSEHSKEYCYYIFHKIRQEICKISISKLNTCKELIIWKQFRNGLIDYSFRKFVASQKHYVIEIGMLSIKQQSFEVEINQHTLVSQVIDQICLIIPIPVLAGYRLVVYVEQEELILRPNQLIFTIAETYNINYQKCYSSTFLSKIKSFGRSFQISQRGLLILKQVIYYPLSQAQQLEYQYEYKQSAYLFKQDKLVGLSKDLSFELIVLYSIRELINKLKQFLPNSVSSKIYQKYVPNSIQEEVQQSRQLIQRIYNNYKALKKSQIEKLINTKLSVSQMYRKYVIQAKVVEMSQNLSKGKKMKNIIIGIGWKEIVIFTINQKIITKFKWDTLLISIGSQGLKLFNQKDTILVKCTQLYEIYQILLQYKTLNEQIQMIKSK